MYSSDNNNLHDHKIQADQILDLIESLGDDQLTAYFKQMDYTDKEKLSYRLLDAIQEEDLETVKNLIKAGADVNITNDDGNSPLLLASTDNTVRSSSYLEKTKILEELIKAGADVNVRNIKGDTALIISCFYSNYDNIWELIKVGADVNIQNRYGETALMVSIIQEDSYSFDQILKVSANINITDSYGRTALIYAVMRQNLYMTHELMKRGADVNVRDKNGLTAMDHLDRKFGPETDELINILKQTGAHE